MFVSLKKDIFLYFVFQFSRSTPQVFLQVPRKFARA